MHVEQNQTQINDEVAGVFDKLKSVFEEEPTEAKTLEDMADQIVQAYLQLKQEKQNKALDQTVKQNE